MTMRRVAAAAAAVTETAGAGPAAAGSQAASRDHHPSRPHWALADVIERGELSVEQRMVLAQLVRNIGALADWGPATYRDPQAWRDLPHLALQASAWLGTVQDYDRLMGRAEGGA
jgi:hypothetical protein